MKRIFAFAVLAGVLSAPVGATWAQGGPEAAPAPQQNAAPPAATQNPLANAAPAEADVVQPAQPRGALGGLASGAPGVAQNVQQLGQAAPQAPVVAENSTPAIAETRTTAVAAAAPPPVMSRAQRHWLVARTLQHCIFFSDHQPHVIRPQRGLPVIGFAPAPFLAHPVGDLELQSVGMVSDAADNQGPVYRITLRNNSTIAARHFRVSLIATLGEITHLSPVVSLNVEELGAGAIGTIDVQLPHGVMTLGPQGQPGPFTTLIAAIDSFDELIERDELNNVAVFTRGEIAVIETTTTAAPLEAAAAPAATTPAAGPPLGAPAAPQAPAPQAPAPGPKSEGEIDQLDLDDVSGASDLLDR